MQVRCTRAFGRLVPGDVAEVPDGADVDPAHFEAVPDPGAPPPPAEPAAAAAPAPAPAPVKEMTDGS
jgi:hypothetical protein